MTRTKLTPKQRQEYLPWNRARQRRKRIYPFKIKLTLPEQKRVNIAKGGVNISLREMPENFNLI